MQIVQFCEIAIRISGPDIRYVEFVVFFLSSVGIILYKEIGLKAIYSLIIGPFVRY